MAVKTRYNLRRRPKRRNAASAAPRRAPARTEVGQSPNRVQRVSPSSSRTSAMNDRFTHVGVTTAFSPLAVVHALTPVFTTRTRSRPRFDRTHPGDHMMEKGFGRIPEPRIVRRVHEQVRPVPSDPPCVTR